MSTIVKMAGFALAATLRMNAAEAKDLRIAPAGPPPHPAYYMYEHFAEYLSDASGGSMSNNPWA